MAAQAPFAVPTPPPSSRDVLALDYQWTNEQIKLLTDIRFDSSLSCRRWSESQPRPCRWGSAKLRYRPC